MEELIIFYDCCCYREMCNLRDIKTKNFSFFGKFFLSRHEFIIFFCLGEI